MTSDRWVRVRLGEVVRDRKDWITIDDAKEYVRVSARVRNQGIELRDRVLGREIKTKRQQVVRAKDFLVAEIDAKVGGIGVVPAALDGAIVSSHYFVFEPDVSRVDPEWLSHLTRCGHFQQQVAAIGSTNYAAIRRKHVHDFTLNLPPIQTQRQISARLASVDAAVEAAHAVLLQKRVVLEAVLTELLTHGLHGRVAQTDANGTPAHWVRTTIGDLGRFSGGNGFRPPDWAPSGLPIIRIQNLNGSRDFNYYAKTPEPDWIVEPGELLFAWAGSRGASFGPCIWPGPRGVLNQHIYRIAPGEVVRKQFLYYLLRRLTAAVEKKAHGFKESLVHLRKAELTGWPVFLPPLDEQDRITERLLSLEASIASEQAAYDGLLELRRVLAPQLLLGDPSGHEEAA